MRLLYAALIFLSALGVAPPALADTSDPSSSDEAVAHVVSSVCETDAQCPGRKVCHMGDCRSPHTLNGGRYLMAVGGGMMVPAAVLVAIGLLVQVPEDFAFQGKNGNLSIFLLSAGGAVALAGLAVIAAGLVYRRRWQKMQARSVYPMLAVHPRGVSASLVLRF